ncbi:A disintegrin and metalloproteinase with thrombospondin motifs adt-1-like [Oppia nitens]|uniref:A disintegrin and metalloproteinase with thrombospondin motifs adt-1-like n=1 Tax=Oppia nitens TaxID=1686743 RepID=UPI0023DBA666|nr:A disintegrin and metalloproteinase with thrombospondin motifs adt-1-like [Oppia nitens]
MSNYTLNFSKNVEILDNDCLVGGNIVINGQYRGNAILVICDDYSDDNYHQLSGIFEIDYELYSIDKTSVSNVSLWSTKARRRSKRSKKWYVIDKVTQVTDEPKCGNQISELDLMLNPVFRSEIPDEPDIDFGEAFIKVAVYLDQSLFKYRFRSNLNQAKQFVVLHMAYLEKQLRQPNLMRHIRINLVIRHFEIAPFNQLNTNIRPYLWDLCKWAEINEESNVNVFFAGSNQWWVENSRFSSSVLGLAYTKRLCDIYSCMIVESAHGYQSMRTLVHEFGHNMGAYHDGATNYSSEMCDRNSYIMSPTVSAGKTRWSPCSIKAIRLHLISLARYNDNSIACLALQVAAISPDLDITNKSLKYPGQKWTADQQCKLIFGPNFSENMDSDNENVCLKLKCSNNFFTFSTIGAFEGTTCGPNRICNQDICKRFLIDPN